MGVGFTVSYLFDLDEYSEARLRGELERRLLLRAQGLCDYCRRPSKTSPCKFPERHRGPPHDNEGDTPCEPQAQTT